VTAALAPPEIWEIVTGTVGDAFTEVGAPKELVGTLVLVVGRLPVPSPAVPAPE